MSPNIVILLRLSSLGDDILGRVGAHRHPNAGHLHGLVLHRHIHGIQPALLAQFPYNYYAFIFISTRVITLLTHQHVRRLIVPLKGVVISCVAHSANVCTLSVEIDSFRLYSRDLEPSCVCKLRINGVHHLVK